MRLAPGIFWMSQLLVCALVSICGKRPYVFVKPMGPARDLADFVHAAALLQAHQNPYSDPRFVTPPFSLCIGLLAHATGPQVVLFFLIANILLLLAALLLVSRAFGLNAAKLAYLVLSALCFYPVFFLLNRGNIDGIVLFLFAVSLSSRNAWVQAAALGLCNNLKLYTLVPSFYELWRGHRRTAWLIAAFSVLFALPFMRWSFSFLHNLTVRTGIATGTENLSPALILGGLLKHPFFRLGYLTAWGVSLAAAARRLRGRERRRATAWLTPWMIALPLQVYPYSGILLLCPMADWLSWDGLSSDRAKDWLVMIGLCMAGIQQQAMTDLFGTLVHSHRFFPFLNALGVLLLACSVFREANEMST